MNRLAAGVAGLALAAAVGTAVAAPATAAPAGKLPGVVNCGMGRDVVRPATVVLACADYNSIAYMGHYTSYTAHQADSVGHLRINDCTPNCADGKFYNWPADLTLWRPETLGGKLQFTRLTAHFTQRVPKGYHRTQTFEIGQGTE